LKRGARVGGAVGLTVILADAELELVPAEVAGHPSVRRHAETLGRKPGQILLDQNYHAMAARQLPDGERRGRPDIVQITLLALLESPLGKSGGLEVAIHTRHGELLRLRPDTRLPRGEARFQGLFSKVLLEGRSQPEQPLIWSEGRKSPKEVVEAVAKGPVVRLDETGTGSTPAEVAARRADGNLTAVLGAFPSGTFTPAWRAAAPEAASIFGSPLTAWAVAAELAAAFRASP
jgi:rRNA small subunit pseudouridine methyltransferase Nep1